MTNGQPPTVEGFLTRFHDARPGLTPRAFASLPVKIGGQVYRSSYELLADAVPKELQDAPVLDLACGDGFLLSLLASRGEQGLALFGVDLSAGELAAAARRLGSSAALVLGRAQQLPYRDQQFDFVLCHMALMLMHEVDAVLAEVRRALKRGGTFAGIIGASSPPSPTRARYIEVLSRHSRDPQWATVRFGDPRLRAENGLADLLSTQFEDVLVEDVQVPLRLSPEELWSWLLDMYDLYLLREQDREAVRQEFLEAVRPECSPDGKLDFAQSMRYFSARVE